MSSIKDALEYALNAFEHLHNTQTYQGDNQDFSDEIITMRAALAELEQSKQESAQAVPVYQYRVKHDDYGNWRPWEECEKELYDSVIKHPKLQSWTREARALYTHPAPLDSDTREASIELCKTILACDLTGSELKAKELLKRLEANNDRAT